MLSYPQAVIDKLWQVINDDATPEEGEAFLDEHSVGSFKNGLYQVLKNAFLEFGELPIYKVSELR